MRAITNDKSNWIQMENTRRQILFVYILFVNLLSSLIHGIRPLTRYPKLMQIDRDKLSQSAIDMYQCKTRCAYRILTYKRNQFTKEYSLKCPDVYYFDQPIAIKGSIGFMNREMDRRNYRKIHCKQTICKWSKVVQQKPFQRLVNTKVKYVFQRRDDYKTK